MSEKLPFWARWAQGRASIGRARSVVSAAWQWVRADPRRTLFNLCVLALVALVLLVRGVRFWPRSVRERDETPTAVVSVSPVPDAVLPVQRSHATSAGSVIVRASPTFPVETLFQSPLPQAAVTESPRSAVITYTVQPGDHLASIAARFGLQRETLIWSNEGLDQDPGVLHTGQVLNILPVDGVYHIVEDGETLSEIAERFQVKVAIIANCEYNEYRGGNQNVVPGQKLVVPGGVRAFRARVVEPQATLPALEASRGSGSFVWPIVGEISQQYWDLHRAIDIDARHGDVVRAADAGTVVYASWDRSGYGYLVIIDHGNGFVTYYAHLDGFYVDVGDAVAQGEPLGALGDTGNSTGPHLHFEIRENGEHRNPLGFLTEQ